MSDPPIKLDYSNPLDDQPEGSDALIEVFENGARITIPRRGLLHSLWLFVLAFLLSMLSLPLSIPLWESERKLPDRILFGVIVSIFALSGIVLMVEAFAGSYKQTIIDARPRALFVRRASVFLPRRVYPNLKGSQLMVTMGLPTLTLRGLRMICDLVPCGYLGHQTAILRQRERNELLWMQRQLAKVLDVEPVREAQRCATTPAILESGAEASGLNDQIRPSRML